MLLDPLIHPSMLDVGNLVNRAHPLADGLAAWWLYIPGLHGGGTRYRSISSANVGTLTGMPLVPTATSGWGRTTRRPGGWGELRLDGTGDYVAIPAPKAPWNNLSSLTCMAWMYPTSTAADMQLMSHDDRGGSGDVGWSFGNDNSSVVNGLVFIRGFATTYLYVYSVTGTMTQNAWQHAAVVWTGGTATASVTFYRNGVPVATGSGGIQAGVGALRDTSTFAARIGMNTNSTETWFGRWDDLRVYTRPLGAKEIMGAYLNSRVGYPDLLNRLPLWPGAPVAAAGLLPGSLALTGVGR